MIWKTRITCLLDEYDLKLFVENTVAVPINPDQLKQYKADMAKAKRLILDEFKDHIVSHIAGKDTARHMWEALATLYEGYSKQQNMHLEQQLRMAQMQKGERIDLSLSRLQEIHDQLAAVRSTPYPTTMVRLH